MDGLGGTYFFMDELGDRAAIVKPCDEEPLAPNNPKVQRLLSPFTYPAALSLADLTCQLRLLTLNSMSQALREVCQALPSTWLSLHKIPAFVPF